MSQCGAFDIAACGVTSVLQRKTLEGGALPRRWEQKEGSRCAHGAVGNHAENEFNNRCDELAVAESQKYK